MSEKYINSFIIKNAGDQEQEVKIKIPLEQVEGANALKNEAEATASKLASLKEELEYQEDVLAAQGVIFKKTIPGTYSIREVADGLDIYNNSLAEVKKVEGKTIKNKNLIPYPYTYDEYCSKVETTKTVNGITFTDNGDGMIIVNGTATADAEFMLKGGWTGNEIDYETCMVSGIPAGASRETYYLYMIQTGNVITEPTKVTYLTAKNQRYKIVVKSGTKVDNIVFKPMINVGEIALPFEPYFKGLKSSSFSGIKSTGKNLCKPMSQRTHRDIGAWNVPRKWDGNTVVFEMSPNYYAPNENISINGDYITFKPKAGSGYGMAFDMPCIVGKTYTISVGYSSVDWRSNYGTYDKDGNLKRSSQATTVTINEGEVWLIWDIAPVEQNTEITIGDIQVEYGDAATEYEPYKESVLNFPETELREGDEIDFEKQQIIRKSYTLELTGEERWMTTKGYNRQNAYIQNVNLPFQIINCIGTENMIWVAAGDIDSFYQDNSSYNKTVATTIYNGSPMFYNIFPNLGFDGVQDLESLKQYLKNRKIAGNPITIHYVVTNSQETVPFSSTQITAGNEYRVFEGGTEQVIGNDAAQWGVDLTLTQEYIVKPGGGSDGN